MTATSSHRIATDQVATMDVSTTLLAATRLVDEQGQPALYETLVYGRVWSEWQHRWATRDTALAGHAAVVAALREGRSPDQTLQRYPRREVT